MIIRFLFIFLFFSCAKHHSSDPTPGEKLSYLYDKKQVYCDEGRKILAERKFMDDECDSALFTALFLASCRVTDPDMSAWHIDGKWYRNPKKDCYPAHSASSWSKDMTIGMMIYWLKYSKKQDVDDFVSFGQSHNWDMCGGDAESDTVLLSRCILSPNLIWDLKSMQKKLANEPVTAPTPDPELTSIVNTGFRAHLDVLGIVLKNRLYNGVNDLQLALLKAQAERQPNNGLFVAAYERFKEHGRDVDVLLDEKHFPEKSLPNNHDHHCINYLYSKDEGSSDWSPCGNEPFHVHDGTDFVTAVSLIDGEL